MKKIVIIFMLLFVCEKVYATTPFAPKVFDDSPWAFVVGFAWPDENDKVLIIRMANETHMLSLEELGINLLEVSLTTAGFDWYQQSIGYVTYVQLKGADAEAEVRVFYFRSGNGSESIVDLKSCKLIDAEQIADKEAAINKKTTAKAVGLLKSDNSRDREAGAIHLGQLGAKEHLGELKKLLNDTASYTTWTTGKETKTVYFVKEAAEEAIRLIEKKNANGIKAID